MTSEQKEVLNIAILRVLATNHTRFGLGVPAVATMLVQFGPTPTRETVEEQLEYLSDPARGLAEEVLKIVSKENRAWRITHQGRVFLDERGF